MTTLYLNLPTEETKKPENRTYEKTIRDNLALGYLISRGDVVRCAGECRVVILCKDRKLRSEGTLKELEQAGEPSKTGMLRYNAYMEDLNEVDYSAPPERLKRTGYLVSAEA